MTNPAQEHVPPKSGRKRKSSNKFVRTSRHYIEYIGFLVLRGLIRALPLAVGVKLSSRLWRVIAPKLYRHERALRHIARALPNLDHDEHLAILDKMWGNLGATMAEAFQLDRIANHEERIVLNPSPAAKEILDRRSDIIFVSAHLGNWEISAIAVARTGIDVAGVYQRVLNPYVERAVYKSRLPYYRAGLFEKGHRAVLALKNALKNGHAIALMADLRDVRGQTVTFFGEPAPSTIFPALLARHTGAPLIGVRTVRTGMSSFRVDLVEIPVARTEDRNQDIETITISIQNLLQTWIMEHPEQWMWAHRRWDMKRSISTEVK